MRRLVAYSWIAFTGIVLGGTPQAHGGARTLAGVEVGAVAPLESYDKAVKGGAILSPFAAYMLNDYLGLMGQVQILGNENRDRPGIRDDEATWVLGGALGPRFAVPLKDVEVWATWQGGIFTGLAPNAAITDTSFGYSTGGGVNLAVTDHISAGVFARYNHLDQRVHGNGNAKYITGGVALTYNFTAVSAAAPPPVPMAGPAVTQGAPVVPTRKKIVLRGVNFDFDKSNLRPDSKPVLDEAASTLKQEGTIAVVAEGHTDGKGTDKYNQALSERRARAVRDYLVKAGVAAARIEALGFGESKPVATNDTEDGRAQNRRVELRVTGD